MAIEYETAVTKVEWRRAKVSQNRQVTIPRRFFDQIGINKEVEFGIQNGYLIVRPVQEPDGQDNQFAGIILQELIAEGLSGQELLDEFNFRLKQVRPAVEAIIEESERAAHQYKGEDKTRDIFADILEG